MVQHDEITEKRLFEMYDEIQLGSSEICQRCRNNSENLSFPATFWFVGKGFNNSAEKILFVGKNARGNPGKSIGAYLDCREMADQLCNVSWPYWRYTRNIAERIYGNDTIDNIAFTNIMKCNTSFTIDTTSNLLKVNCIKEMQVLKKEIEIIKPKKIIFLTSWNYDEYFKDVFDEMENISNTKITIGKKKMPWWEFNGEINNNRIDVLRVGTQREKKKSTTLTLLSIG
jgi:hypothetical protein